MSAEKMRGEFEAWWRSEMNTEVMDLHRCEFPMQKADFVQPYACHETDRGWMAWQASRAAIEVELPEEFPEDGHGEMVMMSHHVRAAIEPLGLKVKP